MYIIFEIPLGILFLTAIIILLILKRKFKNKSKLINIAIYILTLVLITSLMYSAFYGFPYPCPCGVCGSQSIDYGLEGVISFFTKCGGDLIFEEFPYYFGYVVSRSIIIHIIILIIKFIINKIFKVR